MKIERLFIYCLLAGAFLLASCSGDDMTDNPIVETLPEGMYPLTFTATQGEVVATPQTRVSDYDEDGVHKSKWTDGDQIKVQIGNGTAGTYTLKADGTINEQAANTPVYWQISATGQTITAWYPASAASNYLKDQSGALPYVLKATKTADFNTKPQLPFTHQLAKFRFKLTGTAVQGVTPTIRVNGIANTTYTNGDIEAASDATEDITPHQSGDYYEVLLLPGQVADNFIKIDVPDIGTYYYTPKAADGQSNLTLAVASCYTYDITVDAPKPTEINLNNATEDITIDKAKEYILSGTTTHKVTISADATVKLKDVTITPTTGAPIQISGNHTATLILEGTNTLTAPDGFSAIWPNEGSTVVIDGNGSLKAQGGYEAAGIGAGSWDGYWRRHAGIVKILGGTINSIGGGGATGIGCSYRSDCYGIEILGGAVTAKKGDGYDVPAIGIFTDNEQRTCQYVTLKNCTINAYAGSTSAPIVARSVSPNVNDNAALKAAGVTLNVYR